MSRPTVSRSPLPPTPSYPDDTVRELAEALGNAYARLEELAAAGQDTTEVVEEILRLKRRLREGGQLKAGDLLLDGRFRLLRELGHGGFATVWKAYDRRHQELVAVKILHGQYTLDRTRRERFFRGSRFMARLHHQGIVRVIESKLEDEGFCFFVMEYLDGGDLHRAVLEGRLPLEACLEIIVRVGDALEFAHRQGVIHRDVKPSNILLTSGADPKLTDFDLVRGMDTTGGTRTGMLGTIVYAAPEALVSAKDTNIQADVYSLGMTTAFVLYGKDLPAGMYRDPQRIVASMPGSALIKNLVVRALSWEPEHRPQSAAAFCDELRAALASTVAGAVRGAALGDSTEMTSLRSAPWGEELVQRLRRDGASLTNVRQTSSDRWFLQVRLPEELSQLYGTAPEVMILAAATEVRGQDLKAAQDELQRHVYDLDPDLLVVIDATPGLESRLDRIYQVWGQWVPWSPLDGGFPPLEEQFRSHLSAYDIFDERDPVRGRQVVGRGDLVADLSKRLRRGQSVGIFGLRKVGKTTVARAVTDKLDPVSRYPVLPKRFSRTDLGVVASTVIWIDVQDVVPTTLEFLVGQLVQGLRERLALEDVDLPADVTGESPVERLNRYLAVALREVRVPICIVFDEYDLLFTSDSGGEGIPQVGQLFRMFRAHAQKSRKLALVFIGRDSRFLDEPEMDGRPNPMFNRIVPQWLGPMSPADADELLRRLGHRVLLDVGEKTASLARRWTGGHPLLHRLFGSVLLDLSRGRQTDHGHVPTDLFCAAVVEPFLDHDSVRSTCNEVMHFLNSWYPEASHVLLEVSHALPEEGSEVIRAFGGWLQPSMHILRKFGILLGSEQAPEISEILRRYVATFIPKIRMAV